MSTNFGSLSIVCVRLGTQNLSTKKVVNFVLWQPHLVTVCKNAELIGASLGKPHTSELYKWFSWGVVSLSEDKSRGLCLVQLCTKYRLVSATSSYH